MPAFHCQGQHVPAFQEFSRYVIQHCHRSGFRVDVQLMSEVRVAAHLCFVVRVAVGIFHCVGSVPAQCAAVSPGSLAESASSLFKRGSDIPFVFFSLKCQVN